ncbi:MAG: phosphopantetheine-binding protein, partial [Segetibacter sp.]
RKALLNLNEAESVSDRYVAPQNELESTLATIWQDLLKVEQVGIYDNFFQLGGHSLLALQLISRIRKDLQVELTIRNLLKFNTVNALSKYLELQINIYSQEKDLKEFDLLNI